MVAVLSSVAGIAVADDFTADPDAVEVSVVDTYKTVDVWVKAVIEGNEQSRNSCNTGNENSTGAVTASVVSDDTTVATVSPSELTFSSCDAPQTITITIAGCSTDARTATVTIRETSRTPNDNSVKGVFSEETILVNVPGASDCGGDPGNGTSFCAAPAAPAWAAAILKANRVKPKQASNLVSAVAKHMGSGEGPNGGPGTSFDGAFKSDSGYPTNVLAFLNAQPGQGNLVLDGAEKPGWACASAD